MRGADTWVGGGRDGGCLSTARGDRKVGGEREDLSSSGCDLQHSRDVPSAPGVDHRFASSAIGQPTPQAAPENCQPAVKRGRMAGCCRAPCSLRLFGGGRVLVGTPAGVRWQQPPTQHAGGSASRAGGGAAHGSARCAPPHRAALTSRVCTHTCTRPAPGSASSGGIPPARPVATVAAMHARVAVVDKCRTQ